MNDSKNTPEQRADYLALAPTPKALVRILAVNVEYCIAKRILDCLEELGITCPETNAPYHARNIQSLQKELIAKGLLLKSNKGLCCPESIRQAVVRECLLNGTFSLVAQAVQKKLTVTDLGEPHEIPQVKRKLKGFVTNNHDTVFRSVAQPDSVNLHAFLPLSGFAAQNF